MILRHMEIHRRTGASLGFGKTVLRASYNLILTSILASVFNPQAPPLQASEPQPTSTRIEDETRDPVDENKKKTPSPDCSSPHYGSFPCLTMII